MLQTRSGNQGAGLDGLEQKSNRGGPSPENHGELFTPDQCASGGRGDSVTGERRLLEPQSLVYTRLYERTPGIPSWRLEILRLYRSTLLIWWEPPDLGGAVRRRRSLSSRLACKCGRTERRRSDLRSIWQRRGVEEWRNRRRYSLILSSPGSGEERVGGGAI
jgi:hypothetical protein